MRRRVKRRITAQNRGRCGANERGDDKATFLRLTSLPTCSLLCFFLNSNPLWSPLLPRSLIVVPEESEDGKKYHQGKDDGDGGGGEKDCIRIEWMRRDEAMNWR